MVALVRRGRGTTALLEVPIQPLGACGEGALVGHVFAAMVVRNADDAALERRGYIGVDEVRNFEFSQVLVDTGSTHLCLPMDIIHALDLQPGEEVQLRTANGPVTSRWWGSVELELLGRKGTYRVLELPHDAEPLLGVVPLEDLGMEIDLRNHVLRVLSESGPGSHLLAYRASTR